MGVRKEVRYIIGPAYKIFTEVNEQLNNDKRWRLVSVCPYHDELIAFLEFDAT